MPQLPTVRIETWRREWDSNPRYSHPYSGFQDRRLRPLGHPSILKFISKSGSCRQIKLLYPRNRRRFDNIGAAIPLSWLLYGAKTLFRVCLNTQQIDIKSIRKDTSTISVIAKQA